MKFEKVSFKIEKSLLKSVEKYANENEINRSEALRNLIQLALKILNLKDEGDNTTQDELTKMNIDMWLIMAQLYKLTGRDEPDIEDIKKDFSNKTRKLFSQKFPNLSSQFEDYISPKKLK